MKLKIVLIISAFMSVCCISQKKTNISEAKSVTIQKIEKFEITERTRGTNRIITFIPDSKIISINGNITTTPLSSDEWKNITESANSIELSKISSFSSPTTDRYSDKALSSTITIFTNGKEYTSSVFDAGKPPKELDTLYKKLQYNIGVIKRSRPNSIR